MVTVLEVDLGDLSRKRNVTGNFEEGANLEKPISATNVKTNSKVAIEATTKPVHLDNKAVDITN